MKTFLLAGLITAIGVVSYVGSAHAESRYCRNNPDDPVCYGEQDLDYDREDYAPRRSYDRDRNGEYGEYDDNIGIQLYFNEPRRDAEPRRQAEPRLKRVGSCSKVGRSLRDYGYRRVSAVDCDGRNYKYVAFRGYQRFLVKVDRKSGRIRAQISY